MINRVFAPFKRRIAKRLEAFLLPRLQSSLEKRLGAKLADRLDLKFEDRMKPRFDQVDATLEFLELEASDLRTIVRHISAESDRYKEFAEQTRSSFDYQWGNITEGDSLLSDSNFLAEASSLVAQYTGLPTEWFKGRRILDAGCGNGRWSATLIAMGALMSRRST